MSLKPTKPRRPRRRLLRLALALAALAVAFALAEIAFRIHVRRRYAAALAAFHDPLVTPLPGRPYYYLPWPSQDTTDDWRDEQGRLTWRWRYTTNAGGFRGRELEPGPNDGLRVLVLGDSYAFGYGVADGEVFTDLLGPKLRARGHGGPVTVFNAGVPGYNTVQELALLRTLLDRVRPGLVVLGFVVNDAEPVTHVPLPPDDVDHHAQPGCSRS